MQCDLFACMGAARMELVQYAALFARDSRQCSISGVKNPLHARIRGLEFAADPLNHRHELDAAPDVFYAYPRFRGTGASASRCIWRLIGVDHRRTPDRAPTGRSFRFRFPIPFQNRSKENVPCTRSTTPRPDRAPCRQPGRAVLRGWHCRSNS